MVTYGAIDWVQQSIEAVRMHTDVPYELIVVDNGSTDGTREWLADHTDLLQYIPATSNLGFAGGNNLAVNYARAPYVCLLNSDALVGPNWFRPLRDALDAECALPVGVVVPMLMNLDGTIQESGAHVDNTGRVHALAPTVGLPPNVLEQTRVVAYGSAACWLLRTRTYRRLGGLDCGYGPAYYEDVDFAFTCREHDVRVVVVPEVRVLHAQGASAPDRTAAERARDNNKARFVARHAARLARAWHIYDLPNEPHRAASADLPLNARRVLHVTTSEYGGSNPKEAPERQLRELMFQYVRVRAPRAWLDRHASDLRDFQPQARLEVAAEA